MGQLVWTKIGEVDIDLLEYTVTPTEVGDNYAKLYQRWTMREDHIGTHGSAVKGEMVREEPTVSMLRGPSSETFPGKLS